MQPSVGLIGFQDVQHDEELQILKVAVSCINDFFRCLHGEGFWISGQKRRSLAESGRLFLEGFCALAARAAAQGRLLWKLRPKLHMFAELVFQLEAGNGPIPNFLTSSCWTDEDFIGKVSQISRSSHRGSTGLALSLLTMQKCLGRYKIQFARSHEIF